MIVFVSGSTKTVARLAAQQQANLGLLLTPSNRNSVGSVVKLGLPWVIDNGAFSGFDADKFRKLVLKAAGQPGLLWVVCPDVVADARATLALWAEWSSWLLGLGVTPALVLQDGQEDLELPQAGAYFVGGSTRFKLSETAAGLIAEGKRRGALVHMGRVNSLKRLAAAMERGCDSVDGSSLSMFGDKYIHRFCLEAGRLEREQQGTLF